MARTEYVFVPVDCGLVFDPRTGKWRIEAVPPAWFLEMTDAGNDAVSCAPDIDTPVAYALTGKESEPHEAA